MGSDKLSAISAEGWHLEDRDSVPTILDVDLGEHAGLKQPRDIRTTIAKAVEDGALQVAGGDRDLDSACFWTEEELVPMPGDRGVKKVTTYRLNRAAALFIVTRLRTPKAVELTLAIVKVFDQVTSGRALAPANQAGATISAEALRQFESAIAECAAIVSGTAVLLAEVARRMDERSAPPLCEVVDFAGKAFAKRLTRDIATYAGLMSNYVPAKFKSWQQKAHNQLRDRVAYTKGHGRSWARLPAYQRADVILALDEMLDTAKKVYGERGSPQMDLPTSPQN